MWRPTISRSRSNAAITLERPLLVKGEPGTGKTVLAIEIAKALGAPLIEWHVKSTTKALQGLYEYYAVSRLRDSQSATRACGHPQLHQARGSCGTRSCPTSAVLLIDEIDKADIEFPNTSCRSSTGWSSSSTRPARPFMRAAGRSSSSPEQREELPDAFLRRCFFHYIRFPDGDTMRAIIEVHFPGIKQRLVAEALRLLRDREVPGVKKSRRLRAARLLKLLMVEILAPRRCASATEEADPAARAR